MSWLDGYRYRRKFTIDYTKIDATLTDFPVMLRIDSSSGVGASDLTDIFGSGRVVKDAWRKRIAVTTSDGSTECPVEIEDWDSSSQVATLWTKVPSISSSAGTDIYLYYGASADNTNVGDPGDAAAQSVWDSDFDAVWHLSEDPTGGASAIKDSTSNNLDGTSSGSMTAGDLVDGKAGKGLQFDGGDDHVAFGNVLAQTGSLSIQCLIKMDTIAGSYNCMIGKNDSASDYSWFVLNDELYYQGFNGGWSTHTSVDQNLAADTWYLVSMVLDTTANTFKMYINGSEVYSAADTQNLTSTTNTVRVAEAESGNHNFEGTIDEMRVSSAARSAAWEKADYNSMFDTLGTWAAEEERGWLGGGYKFRRKITIDNTKIDADLTDFTVSLHLNATAGSGDDDITKIFDDVAKDSNRKKIAVTLADGETQCYVEIERWNTAGKEAVLHAKVAAVDSAADTVIYFYWGATTDNSTYIGDTGDAAGQSAWDDDFEAVWHLSQDPTGGAGCILDSKASYNLTPAGTMTASDSIDATNGKGIDFDGTDDRLETDSCPTSAWPVTLEAVGHRDASVNSNCLFGIFDKDEGDEGVWLAIWSDDTGILEVDTTAGAGAAATTTTTTQDQWHYLAGVCTDDTDKELFLDGATEDTLVSSLAYPSTPDRISIGRAGRSTPAYYTDGGVSEARLSSVARSTAWIKATYNSLFDTLVSWGDEERYAWLPGFSYRRKVTIDYTKFSSSVVDFPVLLRLDNSAGLGSDDLRRIFAVTSDANRKKIAVTGSDGLTQHFVDIEFWDATTNLAATLHTKVPSISSSADTELYFYFGGSADNTDYVGDTGDTAALDVWDSDFAQVLHMNDATTLKNAVDGSTETLAGTLTATDGPTGDALQANADTDYINAGSLAFGNTYTIEAKLYVDTGGPNPGYDDALGKLKVLELQIDHTSGNNWALNTGNGSSWDATVYSDTNLSEETWYNLGVTVNAGTIAYYRDGATDGGGSGTDRSITTAYHIFRMERSAAPSTDYRFNGQIAELRISTAVRSAAWINATSYALDDELATWSEEEAFTWLGQYAYRRQIATDPSLIDSDLSNFPLALAIDSSSGTAATDLSAILAIANESFTLDDDFTGLDGDGYSRQRWHFYNGGGATDDAVIISNALKKSVGGGAANDIAYYFLNAVFNSDFDVEIRLTVDAGPATNDWYILFNLMDFDHDASNNNRLYCGLYYAGGSRNYTSRKYEDGAWGSETTSATADTDVRFNVVRSGTTITTYKWNGSSWDQIAQYTSTDMGPLRPGIEFASLTGWPTLTVSVTDFIVNSGTPDYVEGTRLGITKADGSTKCYAEIEDWDTGNSKAAIHFKAPAVDDTYPTPFYLYYDCDIPDPGYIGLTGDLAAQSVWDSNFKYVYHMNKEPVQNQATLLDSTANLFHGTPKGTLTSADQVDSAALGLAYDFDSADSEYIGIPTVATLKNLAAATAEILGKPTAFTALNGLFYESTNTTGYGRFGVYIDNSTQYCVAFGRDTETSSAFLATGTTALGTTNWRHLAGVWDSASNSLKVLVDGTAEDEDTSAKGSFTNTDPSDEIAVASLTNTPTEADVIVGEVRISIIARSDAWIKATKNTLFDTLLEIGAQDELSGSSAPVSVDLNAIPIEFVMAAASVALAVPFWASAIGYEFTPASITVQEGNVMTGRHLYVTGRAITPFAEGEAAAPDVSGEGKPVIIGGE